MSSQYSGEKEQKPLLLMGYISNSIEEDRAETLYKHPDNNKKKKRLEKDEFIEKDLHSLEYFEPEKNSLVPFQNTKEKKMPMRNLKQERKNNIEKLYEKGKELSDKQLAAIKREGADFLINNYYDQVGTHVVKMLGGPDAEQNLSMSFDTQYLDTPFARENKIYRNVSEVSPFLRGHVIEKIKSQLGQDAVNKIGGIFLDVNTGISKKIAQSDEIKSYLKNNKNRLLDYGYIAKDSIAFKEKNLHNAIGRADIIDMNLTPDGEITFYIIDVYDFNKNDTNPVVQAGRRNQEKGRIIPYFSIESVKIDKERSQRYLHGN